MILKRLTPKHLRIFDDKYKALENVDGKWANFERAFIAAVWAGWFVESPDWPGPKTKKDKIVAYTDEMDLLEYTKLCEEITTIYSSGRQSDEVAKDPN